MAVTQTRPVTTDADAGVLEPGKAVATGGLPLPLEPLAPAAVVAGAPRAGAAPLGTLGGVEVGIWEMTRGAARDVEAEEVLVVLSGSATVAFEDGPDVHLGAGDALRLAAGSRTTWTVHEPLRKVYVTPVSTEET